jgi:hypothetical protein
MTVILRTLALLLLAIGAWTTTSESQIPGLPIPQIVRADTDHTQTSSEGVQQHVLGVETGL